MAKPLPHNVEAEKIVLGAMMTNTAALAQCINGVTVDHFFGTGSQHQLVYQAIRNLFDKHLPVDIQTVLEELGLMKESINAGGIDYLKELLDSVISLSNLDFYLVILQDNKVLRDYLSTIDTIRQNYESEEIDEITQFLSRSETALRKVAELRRIEKFKTALEISQRVEAELKIYQRADGLTGVDVGYKKLNDYTHGLQKGEMTIIAARPSVGKTAFALNLAYNAVKLNPISVAIFSLEMPSEQLVRRLIATDATVSLDNIQTGTRFLTAAQKATVGQSIKNIGNSKLFIDDTPGIKLIDILAKSRQLKAAHDDLGLIVVDYIGLITTGEKRIESRQVEVSNISRALKELARDLKLPVLVISQLSRQVDSRDDKRPYLSDLRESGAIEQDADLVFLMYRPGYLRILVLVKTLVKTKRNALKKNEKRSKPSPKKSGNTLNLLKSLLRKTVTEKPGLFLFFSSKTLVALITQVKIMNHV